MICREYKCIFIHIPKTAGQSIENFFFNLVGSSRGQGGRKPGAVKLAHPTAEEYVRTGRMTEEEFSSYYKFSFVRNPWTRLVSEYKYRNYIKKYSFRDFVLHNLPERGHDDAYRHVMPQHEYLYGPSGKLLVDYVGRFENLQPDFDFVCSKLGINESRLPHVNSANTPTYASAHPLRARIKEILFRDKEPHHINYVDYYDDETRTVVAEMYKKDIELFSYKFGE